MKPICPKCRHPFPRQERGRELGGLWTPRVTPCPSCESLLQWKLWPWRLQWLAALLVIPAILRPTPTPIRIACIVGTLLCGIAIWQYLSLKTVTPTPSPKDDTDA